MIHTIFIQYTGSSVNGPKKCKAATIQQHWKAAISSGKKWICGLVALQWLISGYWQWQTSSKYSIGWKFANIHLSVGCQRKQSIEADSTHNEWNNSIAFLFGIRPINSNCQPISVYNIHTVLSFLHVFHFSWSVDKLNPLRWCRWEWYKWAWIRSERSTVE